LLAAHPRLGMGRLPDDQLRTLAEEHIAYELEMLVWTAMTLYRDSAGKLGNSSHAISKRKKRRP
jgi:hypothetical protein